MPWQLDLVTSFDRNGLYEVNFMRLSSDYAPEFKSWQTLSNSSRCMLPSTYMEYCEHLCQGNADGALCAL